jgi:hypothetical protein
MEWRPALRVVVENVATPFDRVPVPSVFEPSRKVTVPVGVPPAGGTAVTTAMNVTDWPLTDGLLDDETVTAAA